MLNGRSGGAAPPCLAIALFAGSSCGQDARGWVCDRCISAAPLVWAMSPQALATGLAWLELIAGSINIKTDRIRAL